MIDKNVQLLKQIDYEIIVTGHGDSLTNAINMCFLNMRNNIFKEFKKTIIHLEATQIYFEKIDTKKTKEYFMLFFWPREKINYNITAKIIVNIKFLNISEEDL